MPSETFPSPHYPAAKAFHDRLVAELEAASKAWNAIGGVGTGQMGLTPDAVKFSAAYRDAKRAYDRAHRALRAYNRDYQKRFRNEIAADREARRAALLAR